MKLKEKMCWTSYTDMLPDEYRQSLLEGRQVEACEAEIKAVLSIEEEAAREQEAFRLLRLLEQAPVKSDYSYQEPDTYDEILKTLPAQAEQTFLITETGLSHLRGAWYGRMSGCLLGIPVEGWTREKIMGFLKESGQYPITGYLKGQVGEELRNRYDICDADEGTPYDRTSNCWIEQVANYPVDDDVNYPVMALKLVERYGRGFDSQDVGEGWLLGFPGLHACTAERVAYRNMMNGMLPPVSAVYQNPYREWIGAQIRADFFGYINPGNPKEAARMAYLDAAVSHTKNGVYGEMFVAAMISLSYSQELTMPEIVELALCQIPPASRLYKAITELCRQHQEGIPFAQIVKEVHDTYDDSVFFDWCYVLPNALLVTAAILYYGEDFDAAVTNAIYCGFDTDCNAATVGSIVGMHLGFDNIGTKWYSGIEHKMSTSIHGYHEMSIEDAVQRTWKLKV